MNDTVSLTLKIAPALKETLKNLAQENQTSLSQEVSQLLQLSLAAQQQEPAVDNQSVPEEADAQLSASELKQVRALLKKSKKKK